MSPKRRDFLKGAGIAALAAGLPEVAKATNPDLALKLPIVQNRVLSSSVREVIGGKEHYTVVEIIGANGVKHVIDTLLREIGAHKIMTVRTRMFAGAADTEHQESHNHTLLAEVLNVDGLEKTSVTVSMMDNDGVTPPRTIFIKKGVPNPVAGLTDPDEILEKMLRHKKLKAAQW